MNITRTFEPHTRGTSVEVMEMVSGGELWQRIGWQKGRLALLEASGVYADFDFDTRIKTATVSYRLPFACCAYPENITIQNMRRMIEERDALLRELVTDSDAGLYTDGEGEHTETLCRYCDAYQPLHREHDPACPVARARVVMSEMR